MKICTKHQRFEAIG